MPNKHDDDIYSIHYLFGIASEPSVFDRGVDRNLFRVRVKSATDAAVTETVRNRIKSPQRCGHSIIASIHPSRPVPSSAPLPLISVRRGRGEEPFLQWDSAAPSGSPPPPTGSGLLESQVRFLSLPILLETLRLALILDLNPSGIQKKP